MMLIKKTILVCAQKEERTLALRTYLSRFSIDVKFASSVVSAKEMILKDLPHAILSEATLSDGTIAEIFAFKNERTILGNVPIFVNIHTKSKEELLPCRGQSIAGILVGQYDPKTFLTMLIQHENKMNLSTPFFHPVELPSEQARGQQTIAVEAVGTVKGAVILKSDYVLSDHAEFKSEFADGTTAVLSGCNSIGSPETGYYHIFPTARIKGPGRKQLVTLPDLEIDKSMAEKTVIMVHCDQAYFEGMSHLLKGYNIQTIFAADAAVAWNLYEQYIAKNPMLIFFETEKDAKYKDWRKTMEKIPLENRPQTIVMIKNWNATNFAEVRHVRVPFGLGTLLSTIDNLQLTTSEIELKSDLHAHQKLILSCSMKFIGIDEIGGIYSSRTPRSIGEEIELNHDVVKAINPQNQKVRVVACSSVPDEVGRWFVHFSVIADGQSKYEFLNNTMSVLKITGLNSSQSEAS